MAVGVVVAVEVVVVLVMVELAGAGGVDARSEECFGGDRVPSGSGPTSPKSTLDKSPCWSSARWSGSAPAARPVLSSLGRAIKVGVGVGVCVGVYLVHELAGLSRMCHGSAVYLCAYVLCIYLMWIESIYIT